MKKIFAAIIFTSLSLGVFAQQPAPPPIPQTTTQHAPAQKTSGTATQMADSYRCPICGYTGTKPGDCPKDKVALVKVGDYYCPDCYMTSKKAGKCTMCGVEMKKMEASTASATKK